MIDGLIGGTLCGKPVQRVGKSGKPFVTAKVRTPMADGEALFVNVIAFAEHVCAALQALDDGDSVSLAKTAADSVAAPVTPPEGAAEEMTDDLPWR